MPIVTFTIRADGTDVTENIRAALVEMTITDGEGEDADSLSLVLDDIDGSVEAPRTGAVLNPVGGYEGQERDFGLFIVDGVSYDGWPQRISITAKSADAKKLAKQRKPKAFTREQFPTYGDIFADVASEVGISLQMSAELKAIANPYEARTEENGLEFLTRLGAKLNAGVTVKAGNLVVVPKGAGRGASGNSLDRIMVEAGKNLISYQVTENDRPKHSEVEATIYDRAKNKHEVVAESTGLDGPTFLMRAPFHDKDEAKRAAAAKAKDLVRAQAEATFTIDGEPFAQAEAWAEVSGCRPRVDGLWRVKSVTHNFSASAPYTNTLQCEVPSP